MCMYVSLIVCIPAGYHSYIIGYIYSVLPTLVENNHLSGELITS